jgi:hypothetical protein
MDAGTVRGDVERGGSKMMDIRDDLLVDAVIHEVEDKPIWKRMAFYVLLFGFVAVACAAHGLDLLLDKVRGTK